MKIFEMLSGLSFDYNHVFTEKNDNFVNTMLKFQDLSVIQILREINFGGSRSSIIAVFTILLIC